MEKNGGRHGWQQAKQLQTVYPTSLYIYCSRANAWITRCCNTGIFCLSACLSLIHSMLDLPLYSLSEIEQKYVSRAAQENRDREQREE